MNQCEMVLRFIHEEGSITPMDALHAFGCTRLCARIWDLKRLGYKFISATEKGVNRFGKQVWYSRYSLAKEEKP